MKRRFPLATVLRVRTVQQDLARADVVRARGAVEEAHARVLWLDEQARTAQSTAGPASTWLFAASKGLVLAADASRARDDERVAEGVVDTAVATWSSARSARRGVERLAERHQDAVRAHDSRIEQRGLDDRRVRAAGGGAP